MRSKVWKMRDGKNISIKKMGDDHLRNTLRMIERVAKHKHAYYFDAACEMDSVFGGGDTMAAESAEAAFDEECDKTWEDYLPEIYFEMKYELKSRANP